VKSRVVRIAPTRLGEPRQRFVEFALSLGQQAHPSVRLGQNWGQVNRLAVLRPGLFNMAQRAQHVAKVRQHFGMIRPQPDGLLTLAERLPHQAHFQEELPQVVPQYRGLRAEPNALTVNRRGLVAPPQVAKEIAEIDEVERQRSLDERDSLGVRATLERDDPQEVQGVCVLRGLVEELPVKRFGLIQPSLSVVPDGRLENIDHDGVLR
jgi:hypothetical protein